MKKNLMVELKKQHGAWLVTRMTEAQDANAVVLETYLIFTDDDILETDGKGKAKKAEGLFLNYPKLKSITEKLEDERKEKLEKIVNGLEEKWLRYADNTKDKSFKVVNKIQ